MNRRRASRLLLAIAPLMGGGCGEAARPAPEFELQVLSGRFVRLSEFRGRMVLLTFWSTSCGVCRYELPRMERIRLDYGNQGLAVLTVSPDSSDASAQFLNRAGLSLWTLQDPEYAVFRDYGVQGVPTTILIDGEGRMKRRWVGMSEAEIRRTLTESGFQI